MRGGGSAVGTAVQINRSATEKLNIAVNGDEVGATNEHSLASLVVVHRLGVVCLREQGRAKVRTDAGDTRPAEAARCVPFGRPRGCCTLAFTNVGFCILSIAHRPPSRSPRHLLSLAFLVGGICVRAREAKLARPPASATYCDSPNGYRVTSNSLARRRMRTATKEAPDTRRIYEAKLRAACTAS
ncbi:hypothetical protein GH5_01764 [Leishmania sp. Ghana 2012 LV757]|uniref:hypothetical protein n=1 Tax=Leishmania sp. Ghana 2012 LV757 TaxID=2803181 RepID=UPI001B41CB73|nr:hypothetical protein GH5_01764 [Leishmania sp. Ghana 2012 LV757]